MPLLKECKFGFDPVENASISEKIGKNRLHFKPTLTDCDCGTTLGGMNTRNSYKPETLEKQAAAHRKKGWSAGKVARWLAEKKSAQARIESATLAQQADWALTESEWREAIGRLLSSGLVKEFGLLLHWYTGPLSGRLELAEIRNQKLGNL